MTVFSVATSILTGLSVVMGSPVAGLPKAPPTRYFVTFGSSTTQTGFQSNGTLPSPGNILGNPSLPGSTTSGGLNWLGYDLTEFNSSLMLSYNLAVGGATTDHVLIPPYAPTVRTFVDQVDDFEANIVGEGDVPWTSKTLLVGIWIANNDVGQSWDEPDLPTLYAKVSKQYFEQVQRLYELGARNFVIINSAPQHETPLMKTNGANLVTLKGAVELYNKVMARSFSAFRKSHRDARAWLVDAGTAYYEALDDPAKYGAPDDMCENLDGVSCLWWNNYHPGLAIHRLLGAEVSRVVGAPWFEG